MGITPGTSEPRFPGFDVTAQEATWDPVTTRVVMSRLRQAKVPCFFRPEEEQTARALVDRILGQDDEPRVPAFELIDERLAQGRGDGYRYDDMPVDPEAWRKSIAYLDADARRRHNQPFSALDKGKQLRLVDDVRTAEGRWHDLPGARVFSLWVRYACTAFYSHPWAWNEIGFGGPAYPRGYKNLGFDRREPWEVAEHDAADPVPWAERADAARRRHADRLAVDE